MSLPDTCLPPSFEHVRLETERLVLRALTDADRDAMYRIHSDPEAMRYWITPPWKSLEQATALIEKDRRQRAAGEILRLAIERRADAAVVGTCSLFAFEAESRRAEVGYGLDRPAWGQGYAREAVGRLLEYGFDTMRLHRVEADIDPRNTASARLLEHFGFRLEGLLRGRWIVSGEVSDAAIYGLLAADR
jgi:ribosomal-protein-alanine N-acetyltransferase